jgi:DNA-directed RNA polymerase specialized sigma24 family protein
VTEQVDTQKFGVIEKLRQASAAYDHAKVELARKRRERDELVVIGRDLHQMSYSELAKAIGQTKGRVHGILTDSEEFRPAADGEAH